MTLRVTHIPIKNVTGKGSFLFFYFLRNTEICDKRRPSQAYALSFPPVSNHMIQNFSFPAPKQWPLLKNVRSLFWGGGVVGRRLQRHVERLLMHQHTLDQNTRREKELNSKPTPER